MQQPTRRPGPRTEPGASTGPGPRLEQSPFFTSSPFEPQVDPVTSLDRIDLTDMGAMAVGDPHAAWRLLREQAPVFWHEKGTHGTRGKGFWAVSTFEGCTEVHRRSELFSNSDTEFMDLLPEDIPYQLSSMDPPELAAYRKVLQRFFTAKAVERSADGVRAIVNMVLDGAAQVEQPFNFHEQVAQRIPFLATCGLFQMPPESVQALAEQLQNLDYGGTDPLKAFTDAVIIFFDEHTRGWSKGENDSLVCAILDADIDGRPIERADALAYLWVLFVGALDTVAHSSSIGLLSLFHHPAQLERLKNDLSLMPSAVTELLRWTSSSNVVKHLVMADTELQGVQLKQGDYVATFPPSANRDERAFTDPYRFDVGRGREAPVFTFGGGPHLCLGHQFARMELKIIFEELLRRFPNIEQAGPASRGQAFTMVLSPLAELPVRLGTPAA
ncbi:MAG TPA: cytochrome P450 [Pseudonocardia sp.]|nr:cytochrome P450 [Pseudonocardia sp.]